MYTNIIYIALGYKRILHIKVAYINYLTSSLNIYTGKTLSSHPSTDKKPYYNSGLSLNKSIDLTSIGL